MNDQGGSRYLPVQHRTLSHANFMGSRLGAVVFDYVTLTVYCITAADEEMLIAHNGEKLTSHQGEECEFTTQRVLCSVIHLLVNPVEMFSARMVPAKCGWFSLSLRNHHCMCG